MKSQKLVHVSAYYPPHLGGQEYAAQSLAEQLAKAGHQITVIASAAGGLSGHGFENDVEVLRLSGPAFGHAPIMPRLPVALAQKTDAKTVVHLHIGQAFTPEIVWLTAKHKQFRYVAQLHIDFAPSGPMGFLLPLYKKQILRRVLHGAAAVIVLNPEALRIVREVYGYTGKVQIINNGIDEAYFAVRRKPFAKQPPKTLRLLYVGRLTKQKNVPTLLRALAKTDRKLHLDIIGEGDDRPTIEHLITELKLRNVTLHGRLPRDKVLAFYGSHDALIMPSLYEAQPLVLLEALATRIPIIGTNVVGVADHLQDIGILVPPTPDGLADGIAAYDARYAELPNMTARGFARAEQHRWRQLLKQYENLYAEVAAS